MLRGVGGLCVPHKTYLIFPAEMPRIMIIVPPSIFVWRGEEVLGSMINMHVMNLCSNSINPTPDTTQGCIPWNIGKEVPRWGVAEIQEMSPSTTGDVADRQLTNGSAAQ